MYATQKSRKTARVLMQTVSALFIAGLFLFGALSFSTSSHDSLISLLSTHIVYAQDGGGAGGDGGGDGGAGAGGDGAAGDGAAGDGGGDAGSGGGCCSGGGDTGGDPGPGPGPGDSGGPGDGGAGTFNPAAAVCPAGMTGVYPNCAFPPPPAPAAIEAPQCNPLTHAGTWPNCVLIQCLPGMTGVYPNCQYITPPSCPAGQTGYPYCVPIAQPQCPAGTTGTYPNCTLPPVAPVTPTCPSGTVGTYPNCAFPPVTPITPACPSGTVGTYPNCTFPPITPITPTCPTGTTGTYPNCTFPPITITPPTYTPPTYVAPTCQNCNNPVYLPPPVYPQQTISYGSLQMPQVVTMAQPISVSLSAVPYTGLDLGMAGEALYWGFLGVWMLLAVYLIAIRKIQNTLARRLTGAMFGDEVSAA